MAHIQVVQTGSRVETHVRGRVYRTKTGWNPKRQSLKDRIRLGAKKRRRICLLSSHSAKQLENWGVSQPCHGEACNHTHFSRDEVEKMVADGDLRWVGSGENVAAWREPRFLAVRKSGPVACVQWVSE